jgi:hypothetical protein
MYYFSGKQKLRVTFDGIETVERNYSQAFQDMFVLSMLDGKKSGSFLEIGAFHPIEISNTFLLERHFNWTGLSLDIDNNVEKKWKKIRTSKFYTGDAVETDYSSLLKDNFNSKRIDYLGLDIEPREQTLACLKRLPLNEYRFSVITYETDFYSKESTDDEAIKIRNESRKIFEKFGYVLVGKGIGCTGPQDVFEDWYIDPQIIPVERYSHLLSESDFNDSGERFMTTGPFIVATELWDGQGLGNQLWSYAATRAIAEHRNMKFAIMGRERFKGKEFIEIDFGIDLSKGKSQEGGPPSLLPNELTNYRKERKYVAHKSNFDVSPLDSFVLDCPVNCKIDGNFQSLRYLYKHLGVLKKWIRIENDTIPPNWCVIHIRGSDFRNITDFTIVKNYYENAIAYLKIINPNIQFKCVTDDPDYACSILNYDVEIIGSAMLNIHDQHQASHHTGGPIDIDFKLLMSAKYLIIPYSSFSWWAACLNEIKEIVIAPKFWALFGSNRNVWSTYEIATPGFTYLDSTGKIFSYEECVIEREKFRKKDFDSFQLAKQKSRIKSSKTLIRVYSYLLKYRLIQSIRKFLIST